MHLLRDVASTRASFSFFFFFVATLTAGNPTSNGAWHGAGISSFSSLEGTKRPGDGGLLGSADEKNVWEGRRGRRVQQPPSIFSETFSRPPGERLCGNVHLLVAVAASSSASSQFDQFSIASHLLYPPQKIYIEI